MNNFPLCYIFLQFFPQFVFFLSFRPSAATPLSSQAPLPLSFRPSESPCYSAQGLSLSFRKRSLPSVIFLASEAISLSFRESEANREIYFLLHFGAAAASLPFRPALLQPGCFRERLLLVISTGARSAEWRNLFPKQLSHSKPTFASLHCPERPS